MTANNKIIGILLAKTELNLKNREDREEIGRKEKDKVK